MSTAQVGFGTTNGQTFTSGVQGFTNASPVAAMNPNAISPHAIRWMFNPFAFVDISNRPVSGHIKPLYPGKFIPITSQTELVSTEIRAAFTPMKHTNVGDDMSRMVTGLAPQDAIPAGYSPSVRTAFAIASEIEDAYADRGVRILTALTKFDDVPKVEILWQTLVSPGLAYTPDPFQPECPVPNLIILESHLMQRATQEAAAFGDSLEVNPSALVADLLVAVRTAIQLCKNVTRDAKRVVANRTLGYQHAFDAYQGRAFIALGEDVPSDVPQDARFMPNQVTAPSGELDRLRAENEQLRMDKLQRENDELKARLDSLIVVTPETFAAVVAEEVAEEVRAETQNVSEAPIPERVICGATKSGDGTICNASPVTGTARCRHHQEEIIEINKETE